MNLPSFASALVKIEEGYEERLSDPEYTPAQARQWRLRQYRRLRDKVAESPAESAPEKPSEGAQSVESLTNGPRPTFEPRSTGMGDLVLPRQLSELRATARSKGYDADELSRHFYGCHAHELNRETANILHNYVNGISANGVKTA